MVWECTHTAEIARAVRSANVEGRNEGFSPSFPPPISPTTHTGAHATGRFSSRRGPPSILPHLWGLQTQSFVRQLWGRPAWSWWQRARMWPAPGPLQGLPVLWLLERGLVCSRLVARPGPHSRPPQGGKPTQKVLSSKNREADGSPKSQHESDCVQGGPRPQSHGSLSAGQDEKEIYSGIHTLRKIHKALKDVGKTESKETKSKQ